MRVEEFLGGDGAGRFALGRELLGAFGGAFGGVVAAAALVAARSVASGRVPVALDCRFLRGLPAGVATATPTVVHAGRSLSAVAVEVRAEDGRLATTALISLADPASLHPMEGGRSAPLLPSYEEATPWRTAPGLAPIVDTLGPRAAPSGDGVATVVRLLWAEAADSAELTCLAGDLCVGPPVAAAVRNEPVLHPNPDLSLRFAGAVTGTDLVGVGTVERLGGGIAAVGISVWSTGELVAVGASSSLLLRSGP